MPELPRGTDYWQVLDQVDRLADTSTASFLEADAGEKAPVAWTQLATCLAVLDAAGSCRWGCAGGDHAIEYLLKRVAGGVGAAIRLMRGASYDEALNVLRTAGEITNLLTLFVSEPARLEQWRQADAAARYAMLKPGAVLKLLAEREIPAVVDLSSYDLLSRIAHGTTTDAPQAHSGRTAPRAAGLVQAGGVLLVINLASDVTCFALVAGASLLSLSPDRRLAILDDARALFQVVGGVGLGSYAEMWAAAPDVGRADQP